MKGAFTIDKTLSLLLAVLGGIVILAIVLPMLISQNANTGCGTPYARGVASVLSDMTGANIC